MIWVVDMRKRRGMGSERGKEAFEGLKSVNFESIVTFLFSCVGQIIIS